VLKCKGGEGEGDGEGEGEGVGWAGCIKSIWLNIPGSGTRLEIGP
jgi:hypothetical protein